MKLGATHRLWAPAAAALAVLIAAGLWFPRILQHELHVATGDLHELLNQPYFHLGRLAITPGFLIKLFLFLLFLSLGSRWIRSFLRTSVLSRTPWDQGQQYAVAQATAYLVFVFGMIVGLQSLGVDLSSLVVLGGALGIGAGFGLQPIVSNFVSGLVLLVERPVRVGDRIEIGGTGGDVIRIGGRSTWVCTNDNEIIIVPNSEFITGRVTNWTANDRSVRVSLPVGVSYESDPEEVRRLLLSVAAENADVLRDPTPDVVFVGFGDSSLDFVLRVFTERRVQSPTVLKSDLYFAIFRVFREHGIEIPYPQRDLHVKSIAAPVSVGTAIGSTAS